MLFNDLFQDSQSLKSVKGLIALTRLPLQQVKRVHI